jgi:hypothetical protein
VNLFSHAHDRLNEIVIDSMTKNPLEVAYETLTQRVRIDHLDSFGGS